MDFSTLKNTTLIDTASQRRTQEIKKQSQMLPKTCQARKG